MTWFFIVCGVVLFVLAGAGIAIVLLLARAADGYEQLMESEGVPG